MVESTIPIIESVQRFITLLQQQLPQLEAVYLYGSQTQNTATAESDIDVAVVSSALTADLFQSRVMLLRLAAQVDDRIEPAPFRPQDFTLSDPLVSEIQRTGMRLV